jgi:hypothetical protein
LGSCRLAHRRVILVELSWGQGLAPVDWWASTNSTRRLAHRCDILELSWGQSLAPVDWWASVTNSTGRLAHLTLRCAYYVSMLIAIQTPDFDPLENVLKRPIRSSQESITPTLESRKDFTVVVHQHTQVDGTCILRNEATAIEFSTLMSRKVSIKPGV